MDERQPNPPRRRAWLLAVQIVALGALVLTAAGASGVFAFFPCPGCSSYEYSPPTQPLPEELEKARKDTK
jgi:hypothetical protein